MEKSLITEIINYTFLLVTSPPSVTFGLSPWAEKDDRGTELGLTSRPQLYHLYLQCLTTRLITYWSTTLGHNRWTGCSSSQCRSGSVNSQILSASLLSQNCCQAGPWSTHWDSQPALLRLAPEDRLWALSQYLLLRVTCAAQPHIPICIVSGLPADLVNDSRWEMNSSTHIHCTSHMLQLHIDACHHFYNWVTEPSAHFANTSEGGCTVATFTLATAPTRQMYCVLSIWVTTVSLLSKWGHFSTEVARSVQLGWDAAAPPWPGRGGGQGLTPCSVTLLQGTRWKCSSWTMVPCLDYPQDTWH